MVRVKICGITNLRDARSAVDMGADALGLVFAPSVRRITPDRAKKIVQSAGLFVNCVGVFVDEDLQTVRETGRYCRLDTLQLHGSEPPEYLDRLAGEFRIIKAIRVRSRRELGRLKRYRRADAFLLDTYEKGRMGGTGRAIPAVWSVAREAGRLTPSPVILAGGLNCGNVKDAIETARPFAVDVSSGVELRPGKKDRRLIRDFIRTVRGLC